MRDYRPIEKTRYAKSFAPDIRGIEKPVTNNRERNLTGVHIATMCGKMKSVWEYRPDGSRVRVTMRSISTSVLNNSRCIDRINHAIATNDDKCICLYCFSVAAVSDDSKRGRGMRKNCENNHRILTSRFLSWSKLPAIKTDYFRFESHADVQNVIQCINYLMFIEKSNESADTHGRKHTNFGVWTKNPDIWAECFNQLGVRKPDNLHFHLSSVRTDQRDRVLPEYWFVDDVFTVWTDAETATNANVELTCCRPGYHPHCVTCKRCYRGGNDTMTITYTDELLRV